MQFDWRQHLSPRGHISSNQQPVTDAHDGMGFSTGHVPGLLPENKSINQTVTECKLSMVHVAEFNLSNENEI